MAISVDTIFTDVDFQISKELGSGFMSPDAFNSFGQRCNVELFAKYSDLFQERQTITDKILPLIVKNVYPINSTTGRMTYPTDYVDKIAVRAFEPVALLAEIAECDDDNPPNYHELPQIDVEVIDNSMLGNRLVSTVIPPTKEYPIATFYNDYLQFYPIDLGTCIFEYLKKPAEIFWNYTTAANGLAVFNPTGSVDFDWSWKMRNEIVIKICSYFGVSVRELDLVQYSEMMEKQQA